MYPLHRGISALLYLNGMMIVSDISVKITVSLALVMFCVKFNDNGIYRGSIHLKIRQIDFTMVQWLILR